MQILRTERTIIETITLNDAEFFVSLVNSPGWLRFIGNREVNDADDARRYLQTGFLKCYDENGFGYYLVKTLDRTPIGICGFLKKSNLENADFGFALHPDWFGQGLGLESATAVLAYGIRTYSFTVLDAVTSPDNVRSKRLLERLGFIRIGAIGNMENTELYRLQCASKTCASNYP